MSTRNSNHLVNPAARDAMEKFKMEAASEVGVNLKNGYNGDITSRQAGSVGGQMVNIMTPVRTLKYIRKNRTTEGHTVVVTYQCQAEIWRPALYKAEKRPQIPE